MVLAFDSKSLRDICEKEEYAKQELNPLVAEVLKRRLADLRAASSIKDLLVGQPRTLVDTNHRVMIIDLCNDYKIFFCANHLKNPVDESGQTDWSMVSRVKILQIGSDYV